MNNVSKFVIGSLGLVFLFLVGCKKEEVEVVDYRARDSKIIRDYLADNSITADSLPSGLYFLIENLGSGKHPNATSSVKIRYTGYLTNGTKFDESNGPVTFLLRNLIVGWQQGIPLFKEGGKGKLFVPSHLGYGGRQVGAIPANSVLIFDIQLDEVY